MGSARLSSSYVSRLFEALESIVTTKAFVDFLQGISVSHDLRYFKIQTMRTREREKEEGNQKQTKENAKPEPPKDYIHVRARKGQATDSHVLVESKRKDHKRMKFLQDLVPGCDKVQLLQNQVEFLSMKLATINPRTDINMEAVLSKDVICEICSTEQQVAQICTKYGVKMGEYFCGICKFYDHDVKTTYILFAS
ncbi:hypothetical protein L1987_38738 [Smallanthus sonchifolius]|uniref:Uncharacterized protein n=1 Tax=Smallanthus sonchifolius TaxID=185202 RepID=A0ACB9HLE5_9ASTR|nr:hypothetical protein L1987_38738 [Smallanthus sonchifolius]